MYAHFPDTTARFGSFHRPLRRLLGSFLFFLASLLLIASMGFAQDPSEYNCLEDFSTQPEAQRFYEANDPEDDPYLLDEDDGEDDGIACESLPPADESGNGVSEPQLASNEQDDSSTAGAQYQQEEITTPDTGGLALLPLAGAALLLPSGGYLLFKR